MYLVRGLDTLYQFSQDGYIHGLTVDKQRLVLKVVSQPCCCSKTKYITAINYHFDDGKFLVQKVSVEYNVSFWMPSAYTILNSPKGYSIAGASLYKSPYMTNETSMDECTGEEKLVNLIGAYPASPYECLLDIGGWKLVMLQTKSKLLNYGMESSWVVGWMQE